MPLALPNAQSPLRKDVHKSFNISLLSKSAGPNKRTLAHLAVYSKGNAGDHLLPVTIRDLFDLVIGPSRWRLKNIRPLFEKDDIREITRSHGIIVGGGGLFLRDRNENQNSGWQWNCSLKRLDHINVPLVVFAVGYNRFREQPDFEPIFREHIKLLAEKSVYLGLRNQGSIRAIRTYLPDTLHSKLRFQPCVTTLLRKLYPDLTRREKTLPSRPVISLNVAFDRPESRFGDGELEILSNIARGMKRLSELADIHLVVQGSNDDHFTPFLRGFKVPFQKIDLRLLGPADIVRYYSGVDLALGMRGHSQMIPFGCGTPILSLIAHDKVLWFLEDIKQTDWGIEIKDPDLTDLIVTKSLQILNSAEAVRTRLAQIQDELWNVSVENVRLAEANFRQTERIESPAGPAI